MSMVAHKAVVDPSLQQFRALKPGQDSRVRAGAVEVNSSLFNGQLVFKLCEQGRLTEAVEELELLVQRGCHVGKYLLSQVVKKCKGQKNLVLGKRVHGLAVIGGYESNAFLANYMIGMYAAHGKLEEAKEVFDKVGGAANVHLWASIILAHARHGQPAQAIRLYHRMQESSMKPDDHVFVAALKACTLAVDLTSGRQIHADILRNVVHPNVFVGSCLVDMYAKCGSLEDARVVFDKLSKKNVVTWTTMIAGYAHQGLGQEALAIYASMLLEGTTPANDVTFICLLQSCASVGALHQGKELHQQVINNGMEKNIAVGNCLVNMYAKCGSLGDARRVFDNMLARDVVTWTTMIAGYAQHGLGQEALALYGTMQQQHIAPDDTIIFVCLLQACAAGRDLHQGKQLHAQIKLKGLEDAVVIRNCLVSMYAKCASLKDARDVFDTSPTRDIVTWNSMISGYAQHGFSQEALSLGRDMQNEGKVLNGVTFACLLKACASVGALNQGKHLHAQIQARGMENEVIVGNALVDMYAKCGRLDEARQVFNGLQCRDVVTWNALLNGYAEHSAGQMARQCFQDMQQQGVEPNDATFISLLVACSHEGLVDEGRRVFQVMVEDYCIEPTLPHYNCMVDLIGRSGYLEEAETMLSTSPFENDIVGWTSLLSSCKSHGDVERGRRCFDRLVALEPANGTAYVLFATLCANAGNWADALNVESFRKSSGAKKVPARACIELKRIVHEFTVGEQSSDLSLSLSRINSNLKESGGHVPHTELVLRALSEGRKEESLCGHAEKLALAYGLMNTPHGTTLLINKNLRMCNDCHSSTKVLSLLEKREIVVRDAHRVHHFVNGSCSCRDLH